MYGRRTLLALVVAVCVGTLGALPVPNILDAPRTTDDMIPAAIIGKPRPLLESEGGTKVYDLASSITDDGLVAFESVHIGYLRSPLYAMPAGQRSRWY